MKILYVCNRVLLLLVSSSVRLGSRNILFAVYTR